MQAWINFFVSWIPLLLLVVFWIYFMKRMRPSRYAQLVERSFEHMDRVEALLERIAAAVENKNRP